MDSDGDRGVFGNLHVELRWPDAGKRQLARFLLAAADEKEKRRLQFEHMHVRELNSNWNDKWPDIIVSRLWSVPLRARHR
jgi:hypothetical protein